MQNTRVKICGITRPEDAALAAEYGADAIGLNFVGGPRQITMDTAIEITVTLPLFIFPVVLAQTQELDDIDRQDMQGVLWQHRCFYQLYGDIYAMPPDIYDDHWPVFPIAGRQALQQLAANVRRLRWTPRAVLLDAASEKLGGTGHSFNWNWIAQAREAGELTNLPPLILAGGLTPDNVADAIRIARPYAVDVSSGVEVPNQPGIKDPLKMRDFIQAAKSAL